MVGSTCRSHRFAGQPPRSFVLAVVSAVSAVVLAVVLAAVLAIVSAVFPAIVLAALVCYGPWCSTLKYV
jgi:hypothetical protein